MAALNRNRRAERHFPAASILVTLLVLVLGVVVLRDPEGMPGWFQRFGLIPAEFWRANNTDTLWSSGQWIRPVTSMFFHLDWLHLLGNMAFFWLFAQRIERFLGSLWFLTLVLGCGSLAGIITAWHFADSSAAIIGASGATAALLGAFLGLNPMARLGVLLPLGVYWQQIRIPGMVLIGSWFALQVLFSVISDRVEEIAWWSHIAGFLSGLVLAGLIHLTGRSAQLSNG